MAVAPSGAGAALHHSLIYHSDEEYLAGVVPYLREGADAGDAMLAIVTAGQRAMVERALGADADAVEWALPERFYTYPAHTLRRAVEFSRSHAGRQVRMLGEIPWAGRSALEIAEWVRYEAVVNMVFPLTPVVCSYDARILDGEVLAAAVCTHPTLLRGPEASRGIGFVDPVDVVHGCDVEPLPAPPLDARTRFFTVGDLRATRDFVAREAAAAGRDPGRVEELVLAANEAATNALEHGGGRGVVRIWEEPGRVICEVSNAEGAISDPFVGLLPPAPENPRGRGLWLIRQCADLVQVRSDGPGCTVRMHVFC